MQLVKVDIHGYRRFRDKSSMNLDGKVIAVIGPNESGKSSFLKALQRLNDRKEFASSGANRELSRGAEPPENQGVIKATFLLEPADVAAVEKIEDTASIRWLTITKHANGELFYGITPRPKPDRSRRLAVRDSLADVALDVQSSAIESDVVQGLPKRMATLIVALDSDTETLPSDAVTEAKAIADAFLSSGLAANIEPLQNLAKELRALAENNEAETPHQKAVNVFASRKPLFLLFDSAARDLLSEYNLTEVAPDPPVALGNLARLAELDLVALQKAISENDQGEVETIISRANKTLRDVFAKSWSQSSLSVHLTVSDQALHVLVSEAGGSYVTIAERSDGMRQYVALLAYVSLQETDRPPILLVDEAETHLHYDAQADLVQMFARQRVATKVIYTTHSVGCLPEDLGTGVRIIQPIENRLSVIQNWFWESDEPGFSPLLFGIGAKTLAFLPVRYALVTEGATDIILLPALMREATKEAYLGFQVAPGLSEASEADVGLLENGAPRTAYLVDGDDAGKRIKAKLIAAGISDQRIFALAEPGSVSFVLEDLVKKSAYLKAVNEELRRSHGENYFMLEAEIPETQRPKAIKVWCEAKGIKPPSKRAVAYRVLENKSETSEELDRGILEERHHGYLESLYFKILSALSIVK